MVARLAPLLGADYDDLNAHLLVLRWLRPDEARWKLRLRLIDWWRDSRGRYAYAAGVREVPLPDVVDLEPDRVPDRIDLERALAQLEPIERASVLTFVTGQTLREFGTVHGFTEGRACQIRKAGVARLREVLAA